LDVDGPVKRAFIILPNQLYKSLPKREFEVFILVESNRYFSDFNFHRKKLLFHRASMKYYADRLKKRGRNEWRLLNMTALNLLKKGDGVCR